LDWLCILGPSSFIICIAAYALRFPRLPRPAAQNVNWLARQPKREPQRLEHRKLIM
jgi:hypothetical protein